MQMARIAGRREVYIEILKQCNLTASDIDRMVEGRSEELTAARNAPYDALRGGEH